MSRLYNYILVLLVIPSISWAVDANIHFSISDGQLKAEYTFSEPVARLKFLPLAQQNRDEIFKDFDSENGEVLVNGSLLILETNNLEDLSLASKIGNIFFHNDGNLLFYSLLFEGFEIEDLTGKKLYLENLSYYYEGKLLHKRNVFQADSWERYLLLKNTQSLATLTIFGDIYLDPDLPKIDDHELKISNVLRFLTEKLGTPRSKPIIFFSYTKIEKDEDWWADGRVVVASPYVQISLAGKLDPADMRWRIILYHSLYSHEIAHHWNARNLDANADSWIHEGGAEVIAGLVTKALFFTEMGELVNFMSAHNERNCREQNEDFDFAYHCGGFIFDKVLKSTHADPFQVMKEIIDLPLQSEKAVLEVFSKHASPLVLSEIQEILKTNLKQ